MTRQRRSLAPPGFRWLLILAVAVGVGLSASHLLVGAGADALNATAGVGNPGRAEAQASSLAVQPITSDNAPAGWSKRNSSTSRGAVLWTDGDGVSSQSRDVFFFDGAITTTVQLFDANVPSLGAIELSVFSLGSGSAGSGVLGAWRRGTDYAWVWRSGAQPVLVSATNPIDPDQPNQPMNPEAVAVADGCVFFVLQAVAEAKSVKHVFRVDPASGVATNLSGNSPAPGAGRVSTSGCQAVWAWDDGAGSTKLHFYNGSAVAEVDSSIDVAGSSFPQIGQGRIVYAKTINGIRQIFAYDSTTASPTPVQLTANTTGSNSSPQTDGRHVAWLRDDGGVKNIVLNGDIALTTSGIGSLDTEPPFQLQRGQLIWRNPTGALNYFSPAGQETIDPQPATTIELPWLADGFLAWLGQNNDGGSDREVFRAAGTPPADGQQPAPPLLVTATPGDGQVTLTWDQILGATGYTIYLAEQSGVTKDNYQSLPGGRMIGGVTSPHLVSGLDNGRIYFLAIAAVEGTTEGPVSREVSAVPLGAWTAVGGLSAFNFPAVTADLPGGSLAYAAGNSTIYRTTDGGATWTAASGTITGRDVRALGVAGTRVYAATRDGDILRSIDGGNTWATVADGADIGEQNKALTIAPLQPATIYAGDFQLPGMTEPADSFVIKSVDAGTTWTHLSESSCSGCEIRAYAIAVSGALSDTLYAGGTGTPNLVKSSDGGTTWTSVAVPGPNFIYSLAIHPSDMATLYAGTADKGIFKSSDGGSTWTQPNVGLPSPPPRVNALVIDPAQPSVVYAGTAAGIYVTADGGEHWRSHNGGLSGESAQSINALALTGSRQLIAATSAGLYRLDLSLAAPASPTPTATQSPLPSLTPTSTPANGATATARALTPTVIPTMTPTPGNSATATARAMTPSATSSAPAYSVLMPLAARNGTVGW